MNGGSTYSLVRRINKDDLVVLVHTVLIDPVRVEHTEVTASSAHTLFRGGTERALELEVVHSLANGLAERGT